MKRRIAIWATLGFLVACCWVIYTFVTTPEYLMMSLRQPFVKALLFTTMPIAIGAGHFPLPFWCVPPINAASYAVIGLFVEILRRKSSLSWAT